MTRPTYGQRADILSEAVPLSFVKPLAFDLIRDVPNELFESMRVDGARNWRMLYSLVIPLLSPGNRDGQRLQRAERVERIPVPTHSDAESGQEGAATITLDLSCSTSSGVGYWSVV